MKISEKKREKIYEQILSFLYSKFPKLVFTIDIACELARDEEFMKRLLFELKSKGLIVEIKKNPEGKLYIRRSRWKLKDKVYTIYKNKQVF